jgi:hypothetical protein
VYYNELLFFATETQITSAEFLKGVITLKVRGKADIKIDLPTVIGTPIYMITVDHSGDWNIWKDFETYINR